VLIQSFCGAPSLGCSRHELPAALGFLVLKRTGNPLKVVAVRLRETLSNSTRFPHHWIVHHRCHPIGSSGVQMTGGSWPACRHRPCGSRYREVHPVANCHGDMQRIDRGLVGHLASLR
jgi:hypothetical protein